MVVAAVVVYIYIYTTDRDTHAYIYLKTMLGVLLIIPDTKVSGNRVPYRYCSTLNSRMLMISTPT